MTFNEWWAEYRGYDGPDDGSYLKRVARDAWDAAIAEAPPAVIKDCTINGEPA